MIILRQTSAGREGDRIPERTCLSPFLFVAVPGR